MNQFNLSEWSIRHSSFVIFLMILMMVLGVLGYQNLGQSEDPPFTFKAMVVEVAWPGATALEMEMQVVDRLEKQILEAPFIDVVRSVIRSDRATIFVLGKDNMATEDVPVLFYEVRKRVSDITRLLPAGVQGPFFNDEFGDTYGNVFALTGDGYSLAQLRNSADKIRKELLLLPDVVRVLPIGIQDERVNIEIDNQKLANLGFSRQTLINTLNAQNSMASEAHFDTQDERVYIRSNAKFKTLDDVRRLPLRINDTTIRLGEVAKINRHFVDPPESLMRYKGTPAIGLGVAMRKDGDIIRLGKDLDQSLLRIRHQLPVGMELKRVNDQPRAVRKAISEFLFSVAEAIIIVLAVSFFSLGLRAGSIVALTIPVVLAGTFYTMNFFGIGLHQISLGALILSLGLLVDDAIIAIEMMALKMEQGMSRLKAAGYAFTTTAFPMLTGTLVTAVGFLPIALAESSTGEYTRSIFQVVTIALVLSWFAAVIIVPYLGYKLLPDYQQQKVAPQKQGLFSSIGRGLQTIRTWFAEKFNHIFREMIKFCILKPFTIIILTLLIFLTAGASFPLLQQQFFPSSIRPELLIDIKLPEGSSIHATQREANRMEAYLTQHDDLIENSVTYIGQGAPRFYLTIDQQLPDITFAQLVVTTKDLKSREILRKKIVELMSHPTFSHVRLRALRLENGPPVGYPVQFRVSGSDFSTLRNTANQVADVMRQNPHLRNVHLDWGKLNKSIHLELDKDKAISLGITQNSLNQILNTSLNGLPIGEFREGDQTIQILLHGLGEQRSKLSSLAGINIPTSQGGSVPLSQIASIKHTQEEGLIWHRNRRPTITIRGDIYDDIQAPTVSNAVEKQLQDIRDNLPLGFKLEVGGAAEESAKASQSIILAVPYFVLIMLTILMIQLQSFERMLMVTLTAPFGVIGVVFFLLIFNQPFGFVAMLGTLALSGMIMRNSIILIDQIDRNIAQNIAPFRSVAKAALNRFRPIMLTALATILAMVPLSSSVFFGPMAFAIIGGLLVATLLTLLFLPALYSTWFSARFGKAVFFGKEPIPKHVAVQFKEMYGY